MDRNAKGQFVKGMVPHNVVEWLDRVCPMCGAEFKVKPSLARVRHCSSVCANASRAGKPHPRKYGYTPEVRAKMRAAKLGNGGPDHWNWKHGKRRDRNAHWWRDAVFERDDYTCQLCRERGVELHAHHVLAFAKHPSKRHEVENGLALCVPCHRLVHARKVEVV